MSDKENQTMEKFGYTGECTLRPMTIEEAEKNESYKKVQKIWDNVLNGKN